MKKLMLLIIGACVSFGLAAEEAADQHFVWAIDAEIMPEQMEAFMEAKTANAQLHAEYNFEFPYFVFVDDFHVHTVFRLDAFAQLDSAPQIVKAFKERTGGKSESLGQEMSKCVSSRSTSIAVYRSDLSYEPESPAFIPDFSKPFYQVVKFFHIKPDKFAEIQALAKEIKATDEKRQTPQGYMVYELACGEVVPALVVVMRAQDKVSFLTLEKRLQEKYGEEDAEIMQEALALITSSETKEGTFVPEASYVPAALKAAAFKPSPALKKLEGLVGDWTYTGRQVDPGVDVDIPFADTGTFSGEFTTRFVLNGAFLESRWQDKEGPSGAMSGMNITGYDPKTKKYTRRGHSSDGTTSVRTATLQDGVWTSHATMTTPKGAKVLVKTVLNYAPDWCSYTGKTELSVDGGQTWKHWWKEKGKKIGKKATPPHATWQDFEEFCKLQQGRWLCDITWVADWPGIGKKGDKVTAYSQFTVTEDGNLLMGTFYGGNGSGTWLTAFDAGAGQITSTLVRSGGYVGQSVIYKQGGNWVIKGAGSEADGTQSEHTITLTYSDKGNTRTEAGTVIVGDTEIDVPGDIWRRVSK